MITVLSTSDEQETNEHKYVSTKLRDMSPCGTKTDRIISDRRRKVVPVGGTSECRLIIKPTSSQYAIDFVTDHLVGFMVPDQQILNGFRVLPKRILAPLPDVAVHVEQAEVVRSSRRNWMTRSQ